MYSTSVHSKMVFEDKKEPKLSEMDIEVDGYKNRGELANLPRYYKDELLLKDPVYRDEWRKSLWYAMFHDMVKRMKRWKTKRL